MSQSSIHGVLVQVFGCGVLLQGPAGAGKSQLALELLDRGHKFVADDLVELKPQGDQLSGSGVNETAEFLALRCGVIIHLARRFEAKQLLKETRIDVAISPGTAHSPFSAPPRLQLLDLPIPHYFLHQLPGSAICVEAIAQAWKEQKQGYNAADDLAERQRRRLIPQP